MVSSAKGLRLLNFLERLKNNTSFDATTVLSKVNLLSANNGVLKATFTVKPEMCNFGGTLHGGYIATLIDVFSTTSLLSNPKGKLAWTITMDIVYLASAEVGERVDVETKSLKNGNLSVVETFITNDTGKLVAKGTTAFISGSEKFQKYLKDNYDFDVNEE